MTEKVEVQASAELLEASSATISSVVENKKIVDLPLNGRNIYSLLRLTPGVAPSPRTRIAISLPARTAIHQRRTRIDHGHSTRRDFHACAERHLRYLRHVHRTVGGERGGVRVQTNAFSAEYGRSGGGLVTMITKSGTNGIHGSLFHFLRNSKLDSNSWQANRNGSKLPSLQRNQFGGSVGGPVIKNKTFSLFHIRRHPHQPIGLRAMDRSHGGGTQRRFLQDAERGWVMRQI